MDHRSAPTTSAFKGPRLQFLLLSFPLLILVGLQLWFEYKASRDKAQTEVENIAALLASKVEGEMNRARALVSYMTENIRPELLAPGVQREHEDEVRGMLAPLLQDYATVEDCWYFDANGDLLYSSIAKVPPFNINDRSYFQQLRTNPSARVFYSEVLMGRSTNKRSLYLSGALHDNAGRFAGVALVRIDLECLRRMFREVDLGLDGVVLLRRSDDGTSVLRMPEDRDASLASPSQSLLRLEIQQGRLQGAAEETSPVDGRVRMYCFRRIRGCPFFVGVGLSRQAFLASFRRHAGFAGLFVLFAGLGGALVLARLGRSEDGRLQEGDRAREAWNRHRAILDNLDIGIFHVKDRRFTYANRALERLSGYGEGGLLGLETRHLYPTEEVHARAGEDLYAQVGAHGRASAEIQVMRRDGTLAWVEVGMGPVPGSRDEFVGSVIDITARREAGERRAAEGANACEANRRLVSHLNRLCAAQRAPLGDFTALLAEFIEAPGEPARRSLVPRLRNSARGLLATGAEMLDYVSLETGALELHPTVFSPRSLLSEVCDPLRERCQALRLGFSLSIDSSVPEVLEADAARLRQILRTLLSNALRHTREGGLRLEASCGAPGPGGGLLRITVRDTGSGVAPELGEHLLCTPAPGGGNPGPGLGLSLTIAHRLAARMQGTLVLESSSARGSVFLLELPLAAAASGRV